MRVALGIHSLGGLGGVESYVTTIGDQLQRDGHDVWIYAESGGASQQIAEELGLRVVRRTSELPDEIDVMLPQDTPAALELAAARPSVPQVFVSHSDNFDVNLPPQLAGITCCIVTLYTRAHRRMSALSVSAPLVKLRQPVDLDRFKPTAAIHSDARVALTLGNYLSGARLKMVEEACELAGIELRQVGATADGPTTRPEDAFNQADIVFGKAKVVHEAMACGRAVYVLDHNGAEGWVTADNYEALVADNFGGSSHPRPLTAELLAADLAEYDAAMGFTNRDLMVAHHSSVRHASELMGVIREYAIDGAQIVARPDADQLLELARLARMNWKREGEAFRLRIQLEAQSTRLAELERQLEGGNR